MLSNSSLDLDEALLTKKANASVLESIDTRKANVRVFCERFKPSLEYDIVTINDVYGPTAWDANIQALVLSFETREGAAAGMNLSPCPCILLVNLTDAATQWPSDARNASCLFSSPS